MEPTLQDKLREVAEYDGYNKVQIPLVVKKVKYNYSWDALIPVWSKLCKEDKTQRNDSIDFALAVKDDNPSAAFEIVFTIIQKIKS